MEMDDNKRKMDMDKKNKIVSIIGSIVPVLFLVGIGFAFFSASVSNTFNEKLSTETATISLVFDDGDNGISGTLNLGESITKKFTLENTGTVDTYAKINWVDLVNTYLSDSLTYSLEQSVSENGTYTSISSGNVPTSSTKLTDVLENGILVPANTIYYYKLTVSLNNLDINQNTDINSTFSSYFNLEEGERPFTGVDQLLQLAENANPSSTDMITGSTPANSDCTNTLAYDGTTDNNLRYVGADPCNYVTFNGESAGWRIVGVMNNIDDGTGKNESRIKLVRRDVLGGYSWDSSNNGLVNDWTKSELMQELNGDYLDTTLQVNKTWYAETNTGSDGTYDYTLGLKANYQEMIGNAKWYLGGYDASNEMTANEFYISERGTNVWPPSGVTCSDNACPRATEWVGKIALLYSSDVGFAVGGTVRNACLQNNIINHTKDCSDNNWTSRYAGAYWLLNPSSKYSYDAGLVLRLAISNNPSLSTFQVSYRSANSGYSVKPSFYLKSDVQIVEGNGTKENPYIFGKKNGN